MPVVYDARDLEETRRQNAMLARLPRAKMTGWQRAVMQGLLNAAAPLAPAALLGAGVTVENRTVAALGRLAKVQIMRPPGRFRGIHIDIHGGGWTIGRAYMDGPLNAAIAKECGVVVVSVDYRLAPAVPFAHLLDDCETAARWVLDHGLKEFGVDRVTIGGESAGGHLAAVTILRLRGKAHFEKLAGALLVYGCYDLGGTPSLRSGGPDTLVLNGANLGKVVEVVTGGMSVEARRDPALSPLFADLAGLPPALFIVGTADPLIDDSKLMHEKWNNASGAAELVVVPEAPHGFNRFGSSAARKTNAYARAWLAERVAGT